MTNEIWVNENLAIEPVRKATGGGYTYYCYEAPNANAGNLTECSIKRVKDADSEVTWAGGYRFKFNQAWANYASATYTNPKD